MSEARITYDPTDPTVLEDPFPHYRQLRDSSPVYFVDSIGKWAVSRYDDCVEVVRNSAVYSAERGYGEIFDHTFGVEGKGQDHALFRPSSSGRNILSSDPPEHTVLRRLASKRFTVRAIAGLEPLIRRRADKLVEELLEKSGSGQPVDLVSDYASVVPFQAIVDLMDIPEADTVEFRHWVDILTYGVGAKTLDDEDLATASSGLCAFFDEVTERRRAHPGTDVISLLVTEGASVERPLSPEEIVAFAMFLFTAGTDTTTGLLANWLGLALSDHPDIFTAVRRDPSLIPSSVEEMLRFENSNQAVVRTAKEASRLSGVELPAGSSLIALLGSGNRDERHYGPDADVYRVDRNPADALGFGTGIHLCLGAPLARLDCKVAIEALREATTDIQVVGEIAHNHSFLLRACSSIPVALKA